ncbi:MAG TPA: 2-hydroxyacid dehydrogenase [Caulobacteraceae bacterium]|nr:2-hydroxyacid dehydrogenase [Caulobacteraceae bacterium]
MTASIPPQLVVFGDIPPELRQALEPAYELVGRTSLPPGPAPGFDIAVTTSVTGLDAAQMAALPDLKLIACNGAGLENIDVAEANRRGVVVRNTPDAVTTDTADFALALIFAISRRLVEGDRFVRAGRWTSARMAPSVRVRGKRLGIVGFGKIGSTVAERAAALGLKVAYNARNAKPGLPYGFVQSVGDLAEESDYLVLACPGGAETRHLVNAEILRRLGPKGYLINISRGSVVDETALLAALRDKTIAGAALDVFENEPAIDPAFFALENVVLTPHLAAVTQETRADIAEHLRSGIAAFLNAKTA